MSKIEDGGPAFPASTYDAGSHVPAQGMTLRDWFAGQALAGAIAHPTLEGTCAEFAEAAFAMADAMLAARKP